jgi:hypothetical protein
MSEKTDYKQLTKDVARIIGKLLFFAVALPVVFIWWGFRGAVLFVLERNLEMALTLNVSTAGEVNVGTQSRATAFKPFGIDEEASDAQDEPSALEVIREHQTT